MLIPTGFWSYTTSDDTSSRGKLSQLRALLAAELQQQVGRSPKVNIFQDVVAIPPGREWDRQIREAIEDASFIIPIITPGFLQSEWCCREVELFRQREAQLGVQGLVFPLHYVDVDHIDGSDAKQCQDPAVLAFLRTRQWTDFRSLRLRNHDSEDVSLLLERLAKGVLRALRDASIERQRTEEKRRWDEEEVSRQAEAQLHGDLMHAARLIQQRRKTKERERLDSESRHRKEDESRLRAKEECREEQIRAVGAVKEAVTAGHRQRALSLKLRSLRSFQHQIFVLLAIKNAYPRTLILSGMFLVVFSCWCLVTGYPMIQVERGWTKVITGCIGLGNGMIGLSILASANGGNWISASRLFGAFLIFIGLLIALDGQSIIQVERGWSEVIGGIALLTSGLIMIGFSTLFGNRLEYRIITFASFIFCFLSGSILIMIGYPLVSIERGWAYVISGSTLTSCSFVLLTLWICMLKTYQRRYLLLVGLICMIVGSYNCVTGERVVQSEVGWASVIAGSIPLAQGLLIISISGLAHRSIIDLVTRLLGFLGGFLAVTIVITYWNKMNVEIGWSSVISGTTIFSVCYNTMITTRIVIDEKNSTYK